MNKSICVTGADRGLGLELTLNFLERGYTVFAGKYLAEWNELDALAERYGDRIVPVQMDVSDDASIKRAGAFIADRTDKLDMLINNAGILIDRDVTVYDDLNFDHMIKEFNVNSVGPLRMTQALAGLLMNSESKTIVNISSEAGQIRQPTREGWYGYCMSKAALNIQSNILHNHLKKEGGRVLVIYPGWMQTYMNGTLDTTAELTSKQAATYIADTIVRLGEAEIEDRPLFVNNKGEQMEW
ncbi:SDR family NAD(P)-dependent oxidoreductase [Cohnella endophytica]|uniref:SDR family NAD(P)-dependent oxidoreductase n=1 Tax=Cohnella endophytica TaxID=2419778 RepID=A0A494XV48_9BACL|nr:SDR family NAD(P)-dependent oxidoreductase [Cohnella endophytica]RKP51443.1 SDR family NAD(P)-dependent oxidoreductase [Cohnella endophytica]